MIYIVAIILSLVFCVMLWSTEIVSGNISHLKNGREPNAGAAVFPTIILVPVFFCGVAWLLQLLFASNAIWIMAGLFTVLAIFWMASFARLRATHRGLTAASDPEVPNDC